MEPYTVDLTLTSQSDPKADSPEIINTKRAIVNTCSAMADIQAQYGGVKNIPFPHAYWSMQNSLTGLYERLKILQA